MKCPYCHTPLREEAGADAADAGRFGCPSCGGVWLSREALEGAHAGIWASLASMGVDSVEFLGDYLCPQCSAGLSAVCPHDHPELRIDRCGSCHGVWLDRGELAALRRILAEYVDEHGAPHERPAGWSMMKWIIHRLYEGSKGTALG